MATRNVTLIAKLRNNMSRGLQTINRDFTKVVASIAAVGVAAFAAAKKISDYGAQIFDTASATGLMVEDVQALGYAFEQTGGSMSSMSGAIRGLNTFMRTAATGSAEYVNVLNQLGLEYDDLRAMNPADAFIQITDAIGGLDTAMERNIAATTVFGGRYAQQIVGALDQAEGSLRNLTEQFDESGNAMSSEQVEALKRYSDAMTDVGFELKKFVADGLIPVLPALQELAEGLTSSAREHLPGFAHAAQTAIDVAKMFASALQDVGEKVSFLEYNLINFLDKAAQAQAALDDWNSAAERASATQEAATLITALYANAMQGTAEDAAYLIRHLESLEAAGAEVSTVLGNLRERHESLTFDQLAADVQAMTSSTDGLTDAQVEAAQSAIDLAIAELRLQETMAVGPTIIGARIAELQRYREELGQLATVESGFSVGAVGGGTAAEIDKEHESWQALQQDVIAGLETRRAKREELAELVAANLAMQATARAEMRQAEEQAEAARQTALDNARMAMAQFNTDMVMAAIQGEESWDRFWDSFANRMLEVVVSSAFQKLLGLATGGIGGFFGSIFGFKGGGTVPGGRPFKAAGGMTVPGRTTIQGDKVPALLEPGEVVLPRSQVNAMRGGGTTVILNYSHGSMFSNASRADMAQSAPVMIDILRKAGVNVSS